MTHLLLSHPGDSEGACPSLCLKVPQGGFVGPGQWMQEPHQVRGHEGLKQ